MKTYRSSAITVGVLYILGTVSGILSLVVTGELLQADNYLERIASSPLRLNSGALLVLIMGLSLAAMPLFLYPLFRLKHEALALGMVVFRGPLEGSIYALVVVSWLLLSAFSVDVVTSGADVEAAQITGHLLLRVKDIVAPVLTTVFIMGASLLYVLFYLTRLIPRWLSVWGLFGAVLFLTVDMVKWFNIDLPLDALYVPLAVQEMVMALWLIVKGFDPDALAVLLREQRFD